ncbi:uncharacterized protein LOC109863616 isoform X2 [Pseudomyrmex gracilis]|uniref:uncharacterized protein LOC109863616 isoform X2 n=1 Tax=Pseudomyrmex gracilis TaxID=219809 RepID=UPI0009949FCD|nr:uncharacterized protein LOC109863616 isoform X2 [Pseudomyrmex gracilis]
MPWKVGGNFEAVAICYDTNWRYCVKAVANYFWSEIVSDVVDYIAKEGLIWVLIAVTSLILIHIKYRKITYSKHIVLDNQILSNMIYTLQDLELRVNVLTYKMQYGTLPLPHEIYNLNSKTLKKIKMTLSSPCDRKTWMKHMLLSEGTRALSLSRKVKKKVLCDKQTTVNKKELLLMKKKKLKENKSTKDAEEYFQSNENVSTDVNDTSTFFTNFISTLPTTHNVQSSRQMLYEVKKKLRSLHNILQIYQDMNQSSEKLESTNQVDKPNTFTFIKSEIKKDRSKLDCNVSSKVLQGTRSSKMTNSCEYFELGCSRESSSSSIGNSSNASIKLLQRPVENDFSALVTTKPHRRYSFSSNAILQKDCENKQKSGETLTCAQNISNWSCSNNSNIAFKVDKNATKICLNAQSNNFKKKMFEPDRICCNLSVKSFEDKNAQTKPETSLMKEYDIANFEDVFDKNVTSQSGDLSEVSDSNDKKEKSTALLLQEALQFKKALLTQIRSNIKNRDFIENFSLKHNTQTASNFFIANDGNRNCISETPSEYFSITDVAIHNNDTTESQVSSTSSSSSKPLMYKNIITARIPVGVKSHDNINKSETLLQTGTILKNTQNHIKSRETSEKNVNDVNNLTKEHLSSVPRLQDLILTHVKNIREYIDNFLQSQNKTISAACKELRYRSKKNIFHCSNEASRTRLPNQLTNPVVSSPNNSSYLLINTCCKPELFINDDTFKSCTDVCLKRNPKVFRFTTSFENTFKKNTQWLETAEIRQKEMDLPLPIILKYLCKSDLKPKHEKEYVTSKKNNKTHKQVITDMDFQRHAQIIKSEDIVKTTQTNDRSNLISCNNPSYIINNNIASSKPMSNTKHIVKSNKEEAEVLIFDKSEKKMLKEKNVTLNSAASPLCLLLDIKRLLINADSLLNNLNQNKISANNNYLQLKAKSDMSLLTNKSKDLNFSLKKSHSFSTRNDILEHIRKLLRQSCAKLQNSKIKRIENKLQLITRSIILPQRTFTKSFISKNHSEVSARRIKHQTQNPTIRKILSNNRKNIEILTHR